MATYNGNNAYLEIDGVDVSGFYTDAIEMERTNETQDTTAGAGRTHVQRRAGLNDTTMKFVVVYDDELKAQYVGSLKEGLECWVTYGPEGNAAGKPCHRQRMIIDGVTGPNVSIKKERVGFEISCSGMDAAVKSISNGDVF